MARQQFVTSLDISPVTTTPKQISVTELKVTSFIVQNPISNTDYIKVGDSVAQMFEVAPGKDLEINGDGLDNGTFGYIDLSTVYVVAVGGSQTCSVTYLEGF